jgi:hypothetical protein
MTENSSATVGRAAIDAYLDSVELALIAADAPRIDRLQVLQDLESQIADMLSQQPTPLTEESVRYVLDKLEPPSHFAATYGNGKQTPPTPPTAAPGRFARLPRAPWPFIAAASCALLSVACLLAVFAAATDARGFLDIFMFLVVLSFFVTPIALWIAYRQLRARSNLLGRDLVLKSTCVYAALALALLTLFLAVITEGFALLALGVAAFVYFEYLLVRRIWRRMSDALPPQPAAISPRESNGNGASSPVTSGAPMPAV